MDSFICRACGKPTFGKDLRAGCPHCGSRVVELLEEDLVCREEQISRRQRTGRGSSPAVVPEKI